MASLSQGRTAAAQCGLFTYKSVPIIFEPPCILTAVPNLHDSCFYLRISIRINETSYCKEVCCSNFKNRVCFEQILVLYLDKNIPALNNLIGIYYSVHKTPKIVLQHGSKMCCSHTVVLQCAVVTQLYYNVL